MTNLTFLPYAGHLINYLPKLIPKLDEKAIQKFYEIIETKYNFYTDQNRSRIMNLFVPNFLETIDEIDKEHIPFFFEELQRSQSVVEQKGTINNLDLESIILDSISTHISDLNYSLLHQSHDILFQSVDVLDGVSKDFTILVSRKREVTWGIKKHFHNFMECVKCVEPGLRLKTLANSPKIISYFQNHFSQSRNLPEKLYEMLNSYVHAVQNYGSTLEEKIDVWTDKALEMNNSVDDLIMYFNDVHGYFQDDIIKTRGGLPLQNVKRRLQTYLSALTGKSIKIEALAENKLACSLREGIFYFPTTINLSNDDETNFQHYKSLASYQAGAIMFGSYSLDVQTLDGSINVSRDRGVEGFFSSFSNPEFARNLYELFEFARIDKELNIRYPGLQESLFQFKKHILNSIDKDSIYGLLKLFVYGGEVKIDNDLVQDIHIVQSLHSHAKDSAEAVYRIYQKLEKKGQVPRINSPLENNLSFEIENFNTDTFSHLIAAPSHEEANGKKFRYAEWNAEKDSYEENFVQVIETSFPDIRDNTYVSQFLADNQKTIHDLRRKFEALKPEDYVLMRKQYSGDIDYDELVKAQAERNLGITPSEKVYTRNFKNRRSVCSIVLSECSGSLRKFIDFNKNPLKVIDIIKQSQISFSEAIEQLGDRYALASFSGESEKNVEYYVLKDFDQSYDDNVKKVIGSIKPLKQNRDGAGVRHATHLLYRQPEKVKLLFYLMEGIPHDFGYEEEYAIEDTKKALLEARKKGCTPFVLAFGKEIDKRIQSIGDNCLYREIHDPFTLPQLLPELYRKISF